MSNTDLPIVGILCDLEIIGPHPFHIAGNKYIQAVIEASNCLPILIPAIAQQTQFKQLLSTLDGVLLPGGYSMVDPKNYQNAPADQATKLDIPRDQTSFGLIREAISSGVPIFGICRGFQEMNVALGGSLHQKLHEVAGFHEHRENKDLPLEEQYADVHSIKLSTNGQLKDLMDAETIQVNSLHTQGVNQLANKLTIEATSEDGLCEAFSVDDAQTFAIAVQWHPEWQVMKNNKNHKLFEAFGKACKARQAVRQNNE